MAQGESGQAQQAHYAVPQPMPWPIMGSAALFCMALGGVFVMNAASGGWVGIALGLMLLLYMMFRWFGDVVRESESGKYGSREDFSFRWGMSWFIFSEVMFFGAFFGALFWARVMSVPDLASIEHNAQLWPGFISHWPSAGPGFAESFSPMGAWGIPAINTLLLLTGFHGFHVTGGAIMLTVILARCMAGHFKPDQHFGFEGVAWYWHFVDVVWLGLFIFVYWL